MSWIYGYAHAEQETPSIAIQELIVEKIEARHDGVYIHINPRDGLFFNKVKLEDGKMYHSAIDHKSGNWTIKEIE